MKGDLEYAPSWLARAQSNLARCRAGRTGPEALWEDACFDAQQAVKKALKGISAYHSLPIPKTHNLVRFYRDLLAAGLTPPPNLKEEDLKEPNAYAVEGRYPGGLRGLDWQKALEVAEKAVAWAEAVMEA